MVKRQSYRIPPPPAGLITVLAAAVLSFFVYSLVKPAHGAAIPYYTGKPPPSPHYPGRCWCQVHGPRGGCIKWICRPKVSNAAEFHLAQTYDLTGTIDGLAGEDYDVSGTATFSNNAWTVNGRLTSKKLRPPPSQCQTINAPNGNLTDSSGVVWNWGPAGTTQGNWRILRNGQQLTGSAATMSLANDWIFVRNVGGLWFKYAPNEWIQQSGPPAGC